MLVIPRGDGGPPTGGSSLKVPHGLRVRVLPVPESTPGRAGPRFGERAVAATRRRGWPSRGPAWVPKSKMSSWTG
eukprot:11186502-Lingulodinium_polyedra.AAC.1